MKIRPLLFTLLVILSLNVYAHKALDPEKVLFADAYGDTEEDAKASALAELASYFNISVKTSTDSSQKLSNIQTDGNSTTSIERNVSRKMSSVSQAELFGVEYRKTIYDKKLKKYYATAFIDRKKTCSILDAKIKNIEAEMDPLIKDGLSLEKKDPFNAFRNFSKASVKSDELESILEYIRVIDLKHYEEKSASLEKIRQCRAKKDETALLCSFTVLTENDSRKILENSAKKIIAERGLNLKTGKGAAYSVKISAAQNVRKESFDTFEVFAADSSCDITIINNKTGVQIFHMPLTLDETATAMTKEVVLNDAFTELGKKTESTLAVFFDGE